MAVLLLTSMLLTVGGWFGLAPLGPRPAQAIAPPGSSVSEFQPTLDAPGRRWGGRTVSVDVDPGDPLTAIAASESGGLFRTTNGGTSWAHLDGLVPFRMADVKYAPGNRNVVIATAASDSGRRVNGGGIWRSADGGTTWQKPATSKSSCNPRASAWGIAFEPSSTNVYVGTDCGVAVSRDLGATWVHVALPRVAPVVASTGGVVDTCGGDGHHRSTNSGASFSATPDLINGQGCGAPTIHGLAASPYEANVLFATVPGRLTAVPNLCSTTAASPARLLFESDNGGTTWTQIGTGCQSRPPWVVTHRSTDGNSTHFDLYFSGGLDVRRETCTGAPGSTGLRCGTLPTAANVSVDHADPSEVAFTTSTSSNCPAFLISDGGVHVTTDCGATWKITGGGAGGYDALQLYEVAGQVHPGHTDLYVGTQDNEIWASGDSGVTWPTDVCCEGFFFQVPHASASDSGQTVTGVTCAGCSNFKSAAHFGSFGSWNNPPLPPPLPPPAPAPVASGNPFLISPGTYVQWEQPSLSSPTVQLYRSTDTGGTWTAIPGATLSLSRSGRPWIAGPASNPTVYQAVSKPGGVTGLRKITGVLTSSATVTPADTGLNSIDSYCNGQGTFVCPTVFNVDPNNAQHLIAADASSGQMKESTNGGASWTVDNQLTSLMTAGGTFDFGGQAHVIAWDPTNSSRILVGTEAAGIIGSLDGGVTWFTAFGSQRVPAITAFFFDEVQNNILVSSYGRGLWKLDLTPRPTAITYDGDLRGDFHDPVTLSATLYDATAGPSSPVAAATVTLSVGAQSCTAVTNLDGHAACVLTLDQVPGPYTVTASFAGDGFHLPVSTSRPFTITREETTLVLTGGAVIANGQPVTLSAVLREDGTVPISGRTVTFTLGSGASAQTCSGTTGAAGVASCTIDPVAQPLGASTVSAAFAGDAFYRPSSDSKATLVFAFLGRGSFVVGDRLVAAGAPVTFWGARWADANTLSGGAAPKSFKGFASHPASSPPRCGATWTARPGNSGNPPGQVPSFMAVIVSTMIGKHGANIEGDTLEIIVVKTHPGYDGNPGHPGTGTIVASPSDPAVPAIVCHT